MIEQPARHAVRPGAAGDQRHGARWLRLHAARAARPRCRCHDVPRRCQHQPEREPELDCGLHNSNGAISKSRCISTPMSRPTIRWALVLLVTQPTLAGEMSAAIAEAGGFIDRGAKKRTDLFFLNNTEMPAVLIETACSIARRMQTSISSSSTRSAKPSPVRPGAVRRKLPNRYARRDRATCAARQIEANRSARRRSHWRHHDHHQRRARHVG